MEWRDEGVVLSLRRHGESSAVVSVLTACHGRHAGLVRGGAGKAGQAVHQPGNLVSCTWKARLEDHLGLYTCELLDANAAALLPDPGRLAALMAACAVIESAVAERMPHPGLYDATLALLAALRGDEAVTPPWARIYVQWELVLLAELGFGLDLSACAATGGVEDLRWVSPKSGRAVSTEAGAPYASKLLTLPAFLRPGGEEVPASPADLRDGLHLTGYFLERHVFAPHHRAPPSARVRLVQRLVDRAPP